MYTPIQRIYEDIKYKRKNLRGEAGIQLSHQKGIKIKTKKLLLF